MRNRLLERKPRLLRTEEGRPLTEPSIEVVVDQDRDVHGRWHETVPHDETVYVSHAPRVDPRTASDPALRRRTDRKEFLCGDIRTAVRHRIAEEQDLVRRRVPVVGGTNPEVVD